ncbi:helix-turn-helix domain-containing protein [Tenacibaculum xiamenense]|uniref:helix-turn-helix domain-containing protein n=1 Tax=Tenacibaculum xiamenense TaxID=1261553 RepID=UPI0038945F7A
MNQTALDIIMITSVIIGCFLSISLVTSSFYKSRANNYLSLSLFLLATLTLLEWGDVNMTSLSIQILGNFRLDLLFAATLFTYFLVQINHGLLKESRYIWIYFPFIASLILEIPIYAFNLYNSILEFLAFLIRDFFSIGFNLYLILKSRKLIQNSTTISDDKKHWLLRLNLFIIYLIIIWILTRVEAYVFQSFHIIYVQWILMSLCLWWVLYHGIFRLQVIEQKEEIHNYLVSKKTNNLHPKKKIKTDTTSKIISQLYKLMEDHELYKNPFLSRLDLATKLGTSEGYLSQIINQEINKSVIQFVNEYRIEAAKNLLHNPIFNKYSVEAIGLESGFKSKSAFYNVFKNNIGMSPGAYRKLQKTS